MINPLKNPEIQEKQVTTVLMNLSRLDKFQFTSAARYHLLLLKQLQLHWAKPLARECASVLVSANELTVPK